MFDDIVVNDVNICISSLALSDNMCFIPIGRYLRRILALPNASGVIALDE